ncbi:MAG: threonylcarbamoyl-AMP synthase [Candidatus Desulfofervidus auxilii]|nr:threonylcarbamoyl-AMP synthase [Candidatus Desulfofervidus auxilii]
MNLKLTNIEKAVQIIQKGGVVAYPTETFYGLGVNALNPRAVERLFKIKKRPSSKPISIIIPNINWLKYLIKEVPPIAQTLIEKHWPGPLTIIFAAKDILPKELTAETGKIGIRISSHPMAQKLAQLSETPVTATSANLSGMPPPNSPQEIHPQIKKQIDAILDGGFTKGGLPSTVIDVTVNPPIILRKGAIKVDQFGLDKNENKA